MLRATRFVFFGLAVLLCQPGAGAHEDDLQPASFRIGLGASVGSDSLMIMDNEWMFLPVSFANFYVPMIVSDQFTIEPEFGYFRYGRSESEWDASSSIGLFRFGMGAFYTPIFGRTALHLGLRFGIISTTSSYSEGGNDDSRSKTDFFIGPAVGAEYFFSDQFSLGAEIQLNYIQPGNFDEFEDDRDEYYLSNRSHLFIRFYFGTVRPKESVDWSGPREPPVKAEETKKPPPPVQPAKPATPPPAVEAKKPPREQAERPAPPRAEETPPPPVTETKESPDDKKEETETTP